MSVSLEMRRTGTNSASLRPLQKWHCVEEISGKWRIQKCKGSPGREGSRKRARSLRPRGAAGYDGRCDCGGDAAFKASRMERRSHRQLSSSQRECTTSLS